MSQFNSLSFKLITNCTVYVSLLSTTIRKEFAEHKSSLHTLQSYTDRRVSELSSRINELGALTERSLERVSRECHESFDNSLQSTMHSLETRLKVEFQGVLYTVYLEERISITGAHLISSDFVTSE